MRTFGIASIICAASLFFARAEAQEMEPRAYANAPVGMNFLIVNYGHSEGGVVVDASIPLENARIDVNSATLAYSRVFALGSQSAKFAVAMPFATMSGTADFQGTHYSRDIDGLADANFKLSVNLYGAPALSLPDYGAYRQDVIVGVSLGVSAPIGQYDASKVINIGANRWAFKPEVGVSKAIGRWTFEAIGAVALYETNNEYVGTHKRGQDPVYSIQGGVIYSFRGGAWLALFGTYYEGGRSKLDGVPAADLQTNSRAGLIFALPLNRSNSLKFSANTGVSTRTGNDFDGLAIAWQYRWGG